MKYTKLYVCRGFISHNRWLSSFVRVVLILFFTTTPLEITLGQEPFLVEESPAPFDQSKLFDIDVDPQGRMVAVGWQREMNIGGSPLFPLVMIKDHPQDPWTLLDPPDFGWTYYELWTVKFIPGTNGDFVTVGEYLPDPLIGHANGFLLRYHKNNGNWDIHSFQAPGALFHFVRDAVFDPNDSNRLIIVGTRGISDAGGSCFEFTTMVVDYHIDTHTFSVIPTTQKGGLWTIAPLPNGNFITAGIAAADCDYLPYPVVMEVEQDLEIILPNPPPTTNDYWYSIAALTTLKNGNVFMVGSESAYGAENSRTLGFKYNPVTQTYQSFKPLDPDSAQNSINNLLDVVESSTGKIYTVGRTHYIYNNLHYQRAMIQSFDSDKWKIHPLPESFAHGHYSELLGMTKLPNDQIYTVGLFRHVSSYDPLTLILRNEIIIPVELISFSASSKGSTATLYWSTASETNNERFDIERMKGSEFIKIGSVPGFSTTTEFHTYTFNDSPVTPGKNIYRLKQFDFNGSYTYSNELEVTVGIPEIFNLSQNYPNPFNPTTNIVFDVPEQSNVKIIIYNQLGQVVETLLDEILATGSHALQWQPQKTYDELTTGIYFLRLIAKDYSHTIKMMYLK